MASKKELSERLAFRREALDAARTAYLALLNGQVKQYAIGSRNLTRLDLPQLKAEVDALEKEVDNLEAQLRGGTRRKAVAIVPRDW